MLCFISEKNLQGEWVIVNRVTTTAVMETTFPAPENGTFSKNLLLFFQKHWILFTFPVRVRVDKQWQIPHYRRKCPYARAGFCIAQNTAPPSGLAWKLPISFFPFPFIFPFQGNRRLFSAHRSCTNHSILSFLMNHISWSRSLNYNRWYVNRSGGHIFPWKQADLPPAGPHWKFSGMFFRWCCRLTYR